MLTDKFCERKVQMPHKTCLAAMLTPGVNTVNARARLECSETPRAPPAMTHATSGVVSIEAADKNLTLLIRKSLRRGNPLRGMNKPRDLPFWTPEHTAACVLLEARSTYVPAPWREMWRTKITARHLSVYRHNTSGKLYCVFKEQDHADESGIKVVGEKRMCTDGMVACLREQNVALDKFVASVEERSAREKADVARGDADVAPDSSDDAAEAGASAGPALRVFQPECGPLLRSSRISEEMRALRACGKKMRGKPQIHRMSALLLLQQAVRPAVSVVAV